MSPSWRPLSAWRLVVLSRRLQLRQLVINIVRGRRGARPRGLGGVERQLRRTTERSAHQHHGAPVTSEIWSDDVKPRRGDRQHHLSPAVRELRKTVNEKDGGPIPDLEAPLEHVHPEAVDVVDEARAEARRKNRRTVRHRLARVRCR